MMRAMWCAVCVLFTLSLFSWYICFSLRVFFCQAAKQCLSLCVVIWLKSFLGLVFPLSFDISFYAVSLCFAQCLMVSGRHLAQTIRLLLFFGHFAFIFFTWFWIVFNNIILIFYCLMSKSFPSIARPMRTSFWPRAHSHCTNVDYSYNYFIIWLFETLSTNFFLLFSSIQFSWFPLRLCFARPFVFAIPIKEIEKHNINFSFFFFLSRCFSSFFLSYVCLTHICCWCPTILPLSFLLIYLS